MQARTPRVFGHLSNHNSCRGLIFLLCGFLALSTPAAAASWPEEADRPSRAQSPVEAGLPYEALKLGTSDPIGDTFGSGSTAVDATSLDVGVFQNHLVISMTFANTVSPPDSGEADALGGGYIDIDADQDGATGDVPWSELVTDGDTTGMGNEFYVDLFTYSGGDGAFDLFDDLNEVIVGRVAAVFTETAMTVSIPLNLLDGNGSVNVAAVVGTVDEPTDVVPNNGSVSGPQPTAALINRDRFRVTLDWSGFDDPGGAAFVSDLGTDDSALFYFLDPENLEILVKVIDACDFNDHYWVFYAAATDVEFTLTVTDTLNGTENQYTNPLGQLGGGINDTSAFATCP